MPRWSPATTVLAELLTHPGVVEQVELAGPVGVMAFHGGSLERGTDQIARAVSERSGASCYVVAQPDDLRWHVPSRLFDPADSPRLAAFLDHVEVAIALHGYGRDGMFTTLLAGGTNRLVASHLAAALRPALDLADTRYEVVDDLGAIPVELRGLHPGNPVNRARRGGVQLELPPRIRGRGPRWADLGDRPCPHTEALVAALSEAVVGWDRAGWETGTS
jgi:phage replication-related protein YjqB (UPF0714/DUF867 family)